MASLTSTPLVVPTTRGNGTGSTKGAAPTAPSGRRMEVALAARAGYDPVGAHGMRVLVAFGDEYRSYREAIARAVQALRPSTRVTITPLEALPAQVYRLEPHVVICARHSDGAPGRNTTWVTVPTEAGVPSRISHGGYFQEVGDLSLTELLTVLDRAEGSPPTPRDEHQPTLL